MVKFTEEFIKASNNAFPMLKFSSATYFKDKRELTVRFNISAFEMKDLDDAKRESVLGVLSGMFNGVKVSAEFIRAYADINTVKNKVLEYFNRYNQTAFRMIGDDTLTIIVNEKEIEIKLIFDTPVYKMLDAAGAVEGLTNYLDSAFIQEIDVILIDRPVSPEAFKDDDLIIPTTVVRDSSIRLINITSGEKVYAKGKIAGVGQMPNYIVDVKGAADNIVLCGKASNFSKRLYKNKKYNPSDAKSGPETLPFVKFILDDTTSKIECVCFPNNEEAANKVEGLDNFSEIVCVGSVGISSYNGALSFAVNAIFKCEIDYSSINLVSKKSVPKAYSVVFPQPYAEVEQISLLASEPEKEAVNEYFRNKTLVVFDFEATDKVPETAEVIEIGAIKIVDGKPVESFSSLACPEIPIPAEITKITNIDNSMVQGAPSFDSVLPDFFKFTRRAALVGHNIIGYDYPLLKKYADKEGYNFDNDLIDTLLLSRTYLGEHKSHRLSDLSKSLNIEHANAHRAFADVLATYELLKVISTRL